MRGDIGELISYARHLGFITTLSTNGWFLNENLDKIKGLNVIILSLDGLEKVHDQQRKKGSFARVLEAADACNDLGINVFGLTVLTRYNLNQIDAILDLAAEHGFVQIFQPVEPRDFFRDDLATIYPDPADLINAISKLIMAKKKGACVYNSFAYLRFLESWPEYHKRINCWAGRISCVVNMDGTVVPCNNLTKDGYVLNGFDTGFERAFNEMRDYGCTGCWTNCYQENNCIMNLSPNAIVSAMYRLGRIRQIG